MACTPVRLALDELAAAVADAVETPATRAALAAVVLDLEHAAGSALGGTRGEPHVLLVRRFARAHRLLLAGAHPLDVDRVRSYVLAVRGAAARPARARVGTPAVVRDRPKVGA